MFRETPFFDAASSTLLAEAFFARPSALVARDLLGKFVVSTAGDALTAGRIVETEAYLGSDDPGSHAATKGVTPRNAVMYGRAGRAYIYFTYGNHHMLNIVTEQDGVAGAVLIRAIEPASGIDLMCRRREGRSRLELTNGPGKLARALGLSLAENGTILGEGPISVYDADPVPDTAVSTSGRIGLSAGHDLHLRFYVKDSPFVSRGRLGPVSSRRRTVSKRKSS